MTFLLRTVWGILPVLSILFKCSYSSSNWDRLILNFYHLFHKIRKKVVTLYVPYYVVPCLNFFLQLTVKSSLTGKSIRWAKKNLPEASCPHPSIHRWLCPEEQQSLRISSSSWLRGFIWIKSRFLCTWGFCTPQQTQKT